MHKFKLINLLWLLPGPVFYLLYRLSFNSPQFVEDVYSRGIFRLTNQALATLTGFLPFSLGELLLYALILFGIAFLIIMIVKAISAKKDWWKVLLKRVFFIVSACSFIYAMFVGLWAFNYARQPIGTTLDLDTSPATIDELYETAKALAEKAVVLRAQVTEDVNGVFTYSKDKALQQTTKLYNLAADQTGFDILGGSFGRSKPVLFSVGMSYANISGIYFPFTAEANLNADAPDLLLASSALHEAAHQRGFAREDEANFLAYYVASFSNNIPTDYSATMLALIHSMNKLYGENEDLYFEIYETYSDGMIRDLQRNKEYWKAFEGKLSEFSEQVNNTYLKSNMQSDGVKSYGGMVDLLIGLWRAGEL